MLKQHEKTRGEIKTLVEENNIPELKKLLLQRMEFGTAGKNEFL